MNDAITRNVTARVQSYGKMRGALRRRHRFLWKHSRAKGITRAPGFSRRLSLLHHQINTFSNSTYKRYTTISNKTTQCNSSPFPRSSWQQLLPPCLLPNLRPLLHPRPLTPLWTHSRPQTRLRGSHFLMAIPNQTLAIKSLFSRFQKHRSD